MRIAILTVGAGSGHNAAAAALAETAALHYPKHTVQIFDVRDYLDPATRASFISSYDIIAQHLPKVWKFLYYSTGTKSLHPVFAETVKLIGLLTTKKFIAAVTKFSPDHIITTHFFTPYFLVGTNLEKIPLSMVITDYGWHMSWYHPNTTNYFVASSVIKKILIRNHSMLPEHIHISGIPVSPRFYKITDPILTKKKLKLSVECPLVLILTGGSGIMDPTEFIPDLWKIPKVSLVIITGKNYRLQKKISALKWPKTARHVVLGWTKNMPRYIQAADLVISKPGGLTTSECLATGTPMVLISPIPGQEEANNVYLTKIGVARFAKSPKILGEEVRNFLKKKSTVLSQNDQTSAEIILSEILK